jgi:hypothetical protein
MSVTTEYLRSLIEMETINEGRGFMTECRVARIGSFHRSFFPTSDPGYNSAMMEIRINQLIASVLVAMYGDNWTEYLENTLPDIIEDESEVWF